MKPTPTNAIGDNLKKLREELGMSRKELAEFFKVTASHIGAIELGKRSLTENMIEKLKKEMHVKPEFLYTGEGDMFEDWSVQEEINRYVSSICEDKEKCELILSVYKKINRLDAKEQSVVNDLLDLLILKKHPTE